MQDEEIDKIVQDAANQHHPPYDDSAWEKMEQLLDKHLPVKKERDKKPFFFLLFLLLGGTAFYALVYPGMNGHKDNKLTDGSTTEKNIKTASQKMDKQNAAPVVSSDVSKTVTSNDQISNNSVVTNDNNKPQPNEVVINSRYGNVTELQSTKRHTNNSNSNDDVARTNNNLVSGLPHSKITSKGKRSISVSTSDPVSDDGVANNASANSPSTKQPRVKKVDDNDGDKETAVMDNVTEKQQRPNTEIAADKPKTAAEDIIKTPVEKPITKDTFTTTVAKKKEDKKKKSGGNNLGITVSAGTDLSYVSTSQLGKATFIYGAGLSYPIGKHILLRTGFYVSKKVYTAKPDEYNGTTYPYLIGIDGDCKVYEIPLSINYNFGAKGKHNWFGSAGLSSFLMKKEDYVYNYKTPGGTTYAYSKTIDNQNKHFFSVLNLSAGYQYNLSNKISFMAEPFVKLPLQGIGDGKIKLNSAGILLTATIRPFAKKK